VFNTLSYTYVHLLVLIYLIPQCMVLDHLKFIYAQQAKTTYAYNTSLTLAT